MKYNINLNQKALSQTKLDLSDCVILDYLIVLGNSVNEKIEKQRRGGFTWIDYQKIINDNPLLRINSKGAITPRLRRLQDEGFISLQEHRLDGHKKIFFILTEKVDSLFIEMNDPIHETERPYSRNCTNNNINNNNIKDNISSEVSFIIKEMETIDPKNKTYYGNKTQRGACEFLINEYGLDKVLQVVEFYRKIKEQNPKYLPTISSPYELKEKWNSLGSFVSRNYKEQQEIQNNFIT